MDENLAVTLAIAAVLDTLEIRWFLGGSLASSVHGIPRATLDADIVADLRAPQVGSFCGLWGKIGTWKNTLFGRRSRTEVAST
jgi:hypothetical protein